MSSITSKALRKLKQLAACLSGGHGQNGSSPPFATEGPVSVMTFQPLSHYHTTGTCMVTIIMCIVPEAFLRCNESTDLFQRISLVLYPAGQGYNKLITFLGYSNLSTLCRHWYYGVDTHWLVAEAPLCLTEAAVKAQVLGWSNKQAFCFLQHMLAYSMHAPSPWEIWPVITPEYRFLIGWNSLSMV